MKRQRGFSLLEVAIAMAIFAIVMVPAATMWLAVSQASVVGEQLALATNLAERLLESRVRNVPYEAQQPAEGFDAETALRYTLSLSPVTLPGHATPTLRKVEVRVSLPDRDAVLVRLVTYSAKETP